MPNKPLAAYETRTLVDILFILLVLSLSFAPFIPRNGWDGYAPGTFVYQDETYYMRYSDEKIGTDKPHLFLLEGWPVKSRVDIIEFSDSQAFVNGTILYKNFESYGRLTQNGLIVYYSSNQSSLNITKTITITNEKVTVRYMSNQPVELKLTFWRWYFSSVDGSNFRGFLLPITIRPKATLEFEFDIGGRIYKGMLTFSSTPQNIEVWRDLKDLNKILIDYIGSDFSVTLSLQESRPFVFNIVDGIVAFPLMAVVLGITYLKAGRYAVLVKTRVNRAKH
jgi:hypothetical protein